MQEVVFDKKVSQGSRFNQIYIPKYMEDKIEAGDLVQVRLLKKGSEIYYKNQAKLPEFKEYLIKNIFSGLQKFNEIKAVFIVGSFLYGGIYSDIDIVVVVDEEKEHFSRYIEGLLIKKFNQRFHVLLFSLEKLKRVMKKDPIIMSMFNSYISDRTIDFGSERIIDEKHIRFLLMMPEDLLEIGLSSKIFYDNIRRLTTIEKFLKKGSLDNKTISDEIGKLLNITLLDKIKDNQEINKDEMNNLRKTIKEKIIEIKRIIEDG